MKKTIKEIKKIYQALYKIRVKTKPGHPLIHKYRAGRDAARLIWVSTVRPRIDAFFKTGE